MQIIGYIVLLLPLAFGLAGLEFLMSKLGGIFPRTAHLFSEGAIMLAAVAGALSCWNLIEKPFKHDAIERTLNDIHLEITSIKSEIESLRFEGINITKEPPMNWGD